MRTTWLRVLVLSGLAAALAAGEQPGQAPGITANGVFLGRSGKPMVKARIMLGRIEGDRDVVCAVVKILANTATVTDTSGKFQLRGFTPDKYTLVYLPAGQDVALPVQMLVKSFVAVTKPLMPYMKGVELGSDKPFPDRPWGGEFTLLKGHTFYSEGANMKIWNATARRGPRGPYLELRKSTLWVRQIDGKSEIQFQAWSF